MILPRAGRLVGALALTACCTTLVACGSSDDTSTATPTTANATSSTTASTSGADLAAAREFIQPYTTEQAKFPVDQPLAEPPKPGTKVAFLNVGTPVAAVLLSALQEAAKTAGVELIDVKTGADAQSINSALDSVVESKPDAVIDVALDPTFFAPQLQKLRDQGAVVVAGSITNGDKFGFPDDMVMASRAASLEGGAALAAGILDKTGGKVKDFVFYNVPELPFSKLWQEGAQAKLMELCPDCKMRTVDIPVSALGSTAPQAIVADLQAHPETKGFMLSVDEAQLGLPAAMKVARLSVPGMGGNSAPGNIAQVKDGQQTGTLAIDSRLAMWLLMDETFRKLQGEKPPYVFGNLRDLGMSRLIYQDNAPADPQQGFTAFPDYKERFAKLWGGGA